MHNISRLAYDLQRSYTTQPKHARSLYNKVRWLGRGSRCDKRVNISVGALEYAYFLFNWL